MYSSFNATPSEEKLKEIKQRIAALNSEKVFLLFLTIAFLVLNYE